MLACNQQIDHEVIWISREGDHAVNAVFLGAGDDLGDFLGCEFEGSEVAMGIGHEEGLAFKDVGLVKTEISSAHNAPVIGGIAVLSAARTGEYLFADLTVGMAITAINDGDLVTQLIVCQAGSVAEKLPHRLAEQGEMLDLLLLVVVIVIGALRDVHGALALQAVFPDFFVLPAVSDEFKHGILGLEIGALFVEVCVWNKADRGDQHEDGEEVEVGGSFEFGSASNS